LGRRDTKDKKWTGRALGGERVIVYEGDVNSGSRSKKRPDKYWPERGKRGPGKNCEKERKRKEPRVSQLSCLTVPRCAPGIPFKKKREVGRKVRRAGWDNKKHHPGPLGTGDGKFQGRGGQSSIGGGTNCVWKNRTPVRKTSQNGERLCKKRGKRAIT